MTMTFNTETEAFEALAEAGYYLACYHGGNGNTFTQAGKPNASAYRDGAGLWYVEMPEYCAEFDCYNKVKLFGQYCDDCQAGRDHELAVSYGMSEPVTHFEAMEGFKDHWADYHRHVARDEA